MNKLRQSALQIALIPIAEHTETVNGTAVDVSELQDDAKLILVVDAISGATPTFDVEIEDGLTSGGSFASLSPAVNFTQVTATDLQEAIDLYMDGVRNFIRAAITISGTTPVYHASLILIGRTGQG